MSRTVHACVCGLLVLSFTIPIRAQVPEREPIIPRIRRAVPDFPSASKPAVAPEDYAPSGDFRIGVGDVISVSALGVPDLTKTAEVSSSGNITLPYLGEVSVNGLTVYELEKKLTTLFDAAVVKDPQVSVLIREYQSQSVTIIGEVSRPGSFPLRSKLSLINALSLAGWLTPRAGDKIRIQRAALAGAESKIIQIDGKELIQGGDEKLNIAVVNGDVVHVSKKEEDRFYYLLGGVNRPGAFSAEREINLLEAMAFGGGLTPLAKGKNILIIRKNQKGERMELTTNLDDVIKGKKENVRIQENDVVFVPSKSTKNVREELLNGLLTYAPVSFLQSLAFTLFR